ncbi:hypothetical protein TNCT_186611 [Trichonephila clavata]|uniref:Uncharacterized protein n=1 Tax=Trichonephila clavata TaxID=2740835 RepID=A0A8X6JGD3_TRICU|nr:hypothetical protein TNCT_186611 [Trichonephila clavata]
MYGLRNSQDKNHAVSPFFQWARGAYTTISQSRAHGSTRWTLPFVLLGLRSGIKYGIDITAAELVYGTTTHLPREFFQDTGTNNVSEFVQQLNQNMYNFKHIPTSLHGSKTVFVRTELSKYTYVFLLDVLRKLMTLQ